MIKMGGGTGTGDRIGFERNSEEEIEYDVNFKINRGDFPFIRMLLRDLPSAFGFRVEKKYVTKENEEYFYRRNDELIRMRKTERECNISFKNVDKILVEKIERGYKIK